MKANAEAWLRARNLLCVRLDSIGDVLMTGPAIRALKRQVPQRAITVLTSSAGATAARLLPEVDDVIVYDAPWLKAIAHRDSTREDERILHRLRDFDAAAIFTVYSQNPLPSALFCYLAGIPLRLAHCRENPYGLLTDWVPEEEPEKRLRHEVRRQLDLASSVGARIEDESMRIRIRDTAFSKPRAILRENGIDPSRPWIIVHPGASAASRRYPPERFSEAIRILNQRYDFSVVLTGSKDESDLVNSILKNSKTPGVALAGELTLEEFGALVGMSRLLISNNTGAVHVAASVGTPVVDLYALTNPQHFPWKVAHRVLFEDVPCRYCYKSVCPEGHHRCLAKVRPEQVAEAAYALYASGSFESTPDLPPIRIGGPKCSL